MCLITKQYRFGDRNDCNEITKSKEINFHLFKNPRIQKGVLLCAKSDGILYGI